MVLSFIWDMDGTLVDSYPSIVSAVQEVCSVRCIALREQYIHDAVIQTSVGAFLRDLALRYNLDPAVLQTEFNAHNDERIRTIHAMPHACEVLQTLQEAGHRHYVFTHRGASCRAILEHTNLLPYFSEIVTALDGFPRKPAPDAILYLMEKHRISPACCYYVGDRSLDIEAANNAGIRSILYLDPSSPGKATGKETHLISDLTEIPGIISGKQCC